MKIQPDIMTSDGMVHLFLPPHLLPWGCEDRADILGCTVSEHRLKYFLFASREGAVTRILRATNARLLTE